MKIVSGIFKSVYTVFGHQQYDPSKKYVLIPYLVDISLDSGVLVFNVLTREISFFEKKEWSSIESGNEPEDIRTLVKHWYMIPNDINPKTLIYTFKICYRNQYGKNRWNKKELFTILTTTECNAKCYYCYELGCKKRSMSDSVSLDVAKYIENNCDKENVQLKWFGGEPLCNSNAIDVICSYLNEKGINYNSSIVSNGYLFSDVNPEKIRKLWRIDRVQITLDGTQNRYNDVKRFCGKENAFERVLNGISMLIENKIKVNIRLNLSKENYNDLIGLVNVLSSRFVQNRKFVTIYSHPLFEDESFSLSDDQRKIIYDQYISIQEHIKDTGLCGKSGLPKVKSFHCMADNGKSVVILPGGELGLCEHHCDDEYYGTIYDESVNESMIESWKELEPEVPECEFCFWSPACVRIKKCPGRSKCNEEQRRYILYKIKSVMMNKYEVYKIRKRRDECL